MHEEARGGRTPKPVLGAPRPQGRVPHVRLRARGGGGGVGLAFRPDRYRDRAQKAPETRTLQGSPGIGAGRGRAGALSDLKEGKRLTGSFEGPGRLGATAPQGRGEDIRGGRGHTAASGACSAHTGPDGGLGRGESSACSSSFLCARPRERKGLRCAGLCQPGMQPQAGASSSGPRARGAGLGAPLREASTLGCEELSGGIGGKGKRPLHFTSVKMVPRIPLTRGER